MHLLNFANGVHPDALYAFRLHLNLEYSRSHNATARVGKAQIFYPPGLLIL